MPKREPVSVTQAVRGAIRESMKGQPLVVDVEEAVRRVVSVISDHLGDDSLRGEIIERHYTHTITRAEIRYRNVSTELEREMFRRPPWTPKEREFKLAMIKIHESGKKPTKSRICKAIGQKPSLRWPWEADKAPRYVLNGRQSAWQREMYMRLGYHCGANGLWYHPSRQEPPASPRTRTERRVRKM